MAFPSMNQSIRVAPMHDASQTVKSPPGRNRNPNHVRPFGASFFPARTGDVDP